MGVVGISTSGAYEALKAVYERADKLLYEAKSAGRNRSRAIPIQHFDRVGVSGDRSDVHAPDRSQDGSDRLRAFERQHTGAAELG